MPIVVGICGMAGLVGSAPAGSLVITSLGSTTAAGPTTYSYQLSLEPHSALFKGDSTPPVGSDLWSPDFGQIFDFAGYKLGSITFTPNATSGLVDGDLAASTPLKDSGPEALSFFAPVAGDDTVSLVNLKLDFNRDDPLINN